MPTTTEASLLTARQHIPSLQLLRAFAALSVLWFHASRAVTVASDGRFDFAAPWLVHYEALRDFGAVGVDIFFVLSGFLMTHIAGQLTPGVRSARRFVIRRFWRIWPAYALVMVLLFVERLARFLVSGEAPYDLQWVRLLGIFFWPTFDSNGYVQPVLTVGWTLSYEALFYLVFGLTLLVSASVRPVLLILLFGILMMIGQALNSRSALDLFLSNSILFEFLFGVAVALFWQKRRPLPSGDRSRSLCWLTAGLAGLSVVILILSTSLPVPPAWRFLASGSGATLLLIAMLNLDLSRGSSLARHRIVVLLLALGERSYSIYLIHMLVIYTLGFRLLGVLPESWLLQLAPDIVALIMILASLIAGWLFFRWVEQPLLSRLRGG